MRQHADGVSLGFERFNAMPPDEAVAARHQDIHRVLAPTKFCGSRYLYANIAPSVIS